MSDRADRRTALRVSATPGDEPISAAAIESNVAGLVVETERDFTDALSAVDSGAVDCVIADHDTRFDGLSLLETIRRKRPHFPVFLIVDDPDPTTTRRAVQANVTGVAPLSIDDPLDGLLAELRAVVPATDGDRVRMPIHDRTATEEHRLKERALDEAPVGITIADATAPDEPLIYVNDSFEDITGYDKDEAIGVNCRFLQGPDTDVERTREIRDAIENREPVSVELLNYRADGSTFWNNLEITPIRDDDGEVTNFVAFQQDITERKEAEMAIEAERETLRRVLDRVEGLVGDLTEILVRADSRADIHRMTVDRIGDGPEFDAAWIGEYDPTSHAITVAGTSDGEAGATIDLDAHRDGAATVATAVETGQIERFEAGALEPPPGVEMNRASAGVAIPLAYRQTTYGVLAVVDADDEAFDESELTVLDALGRVIGSAINDVLSKRTVTADVRIEVEVHIGDRSLFLTDLAGRLSGPIAYQGTQVRADAVAFILAVHPDDEPSIRDAADRYDAVTDVSVLSRTDEECVLEVLAEETSLVDALASYGAEIDDIDIDGTGLSVAFSVATEQSGRAIVQTLESTYESVDLVAYHESDAPTDSARSFRAAVERDLTERQLTALKKAYTSGFFEWPRDCDGDDLAASMDVVPSTYYQHLRTAEKKLFRAFFEE